MAITLPRSAWTKHGPVKALTPLVQGEVLGLAIHWPGTTGPIGDPGKSKIAGRLEGYRQYHVSFHKWNDIAYNMAVDQAGRIWTLRGLAMRSAANGAEEPNRHYIAVLALVGPGEEPSKEMIEAIRYLRADALRLYPKAKMVRTHNDVRPSGTACPGDALTKLVRGGAFNLPPEGAQAIEKYKLRRQLSVGAVGKDVAALQRRLNAVLKRDTRVDGDFGPDTLRSVKAFQRQKWPLRPSRWDGIVGPLTAGALGWDFGA